MLYLSRKGKFNPASQIIRTALVGSPIPFQSWGGGVTDWHRCGGCAAPWWASKEEQVKEDGSQAFNQMEFAPLHFTSLLFLTALFWNGNEYLSYACPTIAFWEHITCPVSQVHSSRGIYSG